ncbi:MAG TPA: zf-HC2 domain-containing protein [Myxococcota bacterium]|nr:zf-HC2 domain-containing protein [Myxococcota bacterium]
MTSCQLFETDLEALHDGELSRDGAAALRRHVAECTRCAAALARLEAIGSALRERADPAPATDLWRGLAPRLAAIDQQLEEVRRVRRPMGAAVVRPSRWRRFGPPLAAAAALGGLTLLVFGRTPAARAQDVVRSLDTFGAPVVVLPDDGDRGSTVIWLLDGAEGDAEEGPDARGDGHATAP